MFNKGVSIIVPVYNTAIYLERCFDSIIRQTYKNIEIIIVDDGSTDSSVQICDRYAKHDPRFIVIHKTNGGLSSARNAGLDCITKEYVAFVDSDDYIAPDFIEILLRNAKETNSDISVCSIKNINYLHVEYGKYCNEERCVYTPQKAMECFIEDINLVYEGKKNWQDIPIKSNSCDKLFKTYLFNEIKYPIGMNCEDLIILPKVFHKANQIVSTSYKAYFYYQREGSIMHNESYYLSLNVLDGYSAIKDYFLFYKTSKKVIGKVSLVLCRIIFEKLRNIDVYNNIPFVLLLSKRLRKESKSIFLYGKNSMKEKFYALFFGYFPRLYLKKVRKNKG